jgi:LmbE family N-acetylglucosaminyl deacetylase
MNRKVLVIAAHPDDEILGCGGTLAKLAGSGCEVFTLILGTGVASRYVANDTEKIAHKIEKLREAMYKANEIIGVKKVFTEDFPDNKFDTVALLDLIKAVERIKEMIKPDIIFTHYENDLNIDHRITYKATITATRPLQDETVKEIYSFEVPSATEWNFPLSFSPEVFFDITETIELKTKAICAYKSELRQFPHPRSLKGIQLNSQYWGMKVGMQYAEAFKAVRIINQS